jgi:hypothetical protein
MLDRRVTQHDVVEVLDALEQEEVLVWLDGCWAVAALVGKGTRSHANLDLAFDRALLSEGDRTGIEPRGCFPKVHAQRFIVATGHRR